MPRHQLSADKSLNAELSTTETSVGAVLASHYIPVAFHQVTGICFKPQTKSISTQFISISGIANGVAGVQSASISRASIS